MLTGRIPNTLYLSLADGYLESHPRYFSLDRNVGKFTAPHLVPQRSDIWYDQRKYATTASLTSKCLGFFEPQTATALGLPWYMGKHSDALSVFHHIYKYEIDEGHDPGHTEEPPNVYRDVCMNWGTAHEPNAILAFLNEFPDSGMVEFGMMTKTYNVHLREYNETINVTLGASPDGIITNVKSPDMPFLGLFEAKCKSPFFMDRNTDIFRFNMSVEPFEKVPVYYLPQIQQQLDVWDTEDCVVESYSPGQGANFMIVKRDREYFGEMLYYIARFHRDFVMQNILPGHNFFLGERRYTKLLERTLEIAENTKVQCCSENSIEGIDRSQISPFLDAAL